MTADPRSLREKIEALPYVAGSAMVAKADVLALLDTPSPEPHGLREAVRAIKDWRDDAATQMVAIDASEGVRSRRRWRWRALDDVLALIASVPEPEALTAEWIKRFYLQWIDEYASPRMISCEREPTAGEAASAFADAFLTARAAQHRREDRPIEEMLS